jgi:hypothetical protein
MMGKVYLGETEVYQYSEGSTGVPDYQVWDGYPDSPLLTASYPYQAIGLLDSEGGIYLLVLSASELFGHLEEGYFDNAEENLSCKYYTTITDPMVWEEFVPDTIGETVVELILEANYAIYIYNVPQIPENLIIQKTTVDTRLIDTSTATASSDTIFDGYTAFVNGELVTGNYIPLDTSDSTAQDFDIIAPRTAYGDGEKITGTAPYLNLAGLDLSDSQLNGIFTALFDVSPDYVAVDITGCTGVATCDKTIATLKGWTVIDGL